ncbi:MAG: PorV/PorQ family protein [Rhodothermales bacterium]|nr:PorV/PorQ family protein [Rhodothermales bacterium]
MKALMHKTLSLGIGLLALGLLLLSAPEARAQDVGSGGGTTGSSGSRAGTSGATELLVPLTARYTALGGTSTSGLADMNGIEALYANPAGLALNTGTAGLFSRVEYVADIGVNYFGIAQNFGDFNNIAFTIAAWDFGDIPETTEDSPEITDVTFNVSYLTAGLSYSRQITDRIAAGATMKLVNESIDDVSASAVAFDAGMTYNLSEIGLRLGVSLKNIGNELTFTGTGLSRSVKVPGQDPSANNNTLALESEGVQMPTLLNVGLAYTVPIAGSNYVSFLTNFRSNSFDQDLYSGGIELGFQNILYIRGGYQFAEDMDLTFYQGAAFGGGLNLNVGGTRIALDYAYQPTDFFSDVQYITASFSL